ncbi:DUF2750 domain-containing protein [Psychromonas aquimarina]|uniref:DUF2750 domain-containing protein n=1 Tax=Psychromonas aquimarina TaxID=444919 RepID=UPI0004145167|nr:DUF2750 domain-containing protein [Psychromonas aquimarina]
MKDTNQTLLTFLSEVKPTQQLWALQDTKSEDWVVLDSLNYEETEVMPLWSSAELAAVHCTEEWKDYLPAAITLADWLEFWIDDLVKDGVVIGINWIGEENDLEIDLPEFTQSLVDIEVL